MNPRFFSSLILAFFIIFSSSTSQAQETIQQTLKREETEIPPFIQIRSIEILGSSIFTQEQLQEVVKDLIGLEATSENLLAIRSAITQLYVSKGFNSTAAFLAPEVDISQGNITIQIVEGVIEQVEIIGTKKLRRGYILNRLPSLGEVPLNERELYRELQLLAIDPLVKKLNAELSPGSSDGLSILTLSIEEEDSFKVGVLLNNGRSPAVGSFQRVIQIGESSLFGGGESLSVTYQNTDGSNGVGVGFSVPVNAKNGRIGLAYNYQSNNLIEDPVNILDLETEAQNYEIGFRQPILKTLNQEFSLGLTFNRTESSSFFGGERFRISPGQDEFGRTRTSALRFSQDYLFRSFNEVFAISSQFNFGVEVFEITKKLEPDSQFFSWQFQTYYTRLFAPDLSLILRTNLQIANQPLVSDEQFRLGGIESVRGYRQDLSISDNGFFGSAELRIPVVRIPQVNGVLHVAPFVDGGVGWNNGDRFSPIASGLASVGIGLVYEMGDLGLAGDLAASVYYGVPLIRVNRVEDYGNSIYFSIIWRGL
ncbi:ShlB/FhaC/HecB family hemolysin secretion/activation protein [Chroococcus sp. FPU101]|uniref:ShlB/FhaC/HecB family hemolysin secretion/activation protein n=1 Tax=Chroococcus sp. FPU101 TaxID=1974212 RepID=UPI001A8CD372|nr:ShlB/FhaC/HecB family hemolysin secretion/activation protein [Chroococcus sp. FPU101]GFE71822.1 Surface antigen variable number [Chroococcus sp. FPU101]